MEVNDVNKIGLRRMILSSAIVYLDGKVVKNRYVSEDNTTSLAEITDAEFVWFDDQTKTLYLKTTDSLWESIHVRT